METRIYTIAKEFSLYPGARKISEGPYSGEFFRTSQLSKIVKECLDTNTKLVIDLDGTSGYNTSFLEESFGGLIREDRFRLDELNSVLEIKSDDEPYLLDEIRKYLDDAWRIQTMITRKRKVNRLKKQRAKTFRLTMRLIEVVLDVLHKKGVKNFKSFLSDRMGVRRSLIAKLFKGNGKFTVKSLVKMLDAAGLEIEIKFYDRSTLEPVEYISVSTIELTNK